MTQTTRDDLLKRARQIMNGRYHAVVHTTRGECLLCKWLHEYEAAMRTDSHVYLSTACQHGKHEECRLVCKFCGAKCTCGCGHETAMKAEDPKMCLCNPHAEPNTNRAPNCPIHGIRAERAATMREPIGTTAWYDASGKQVDAPSPATEQGPDK